MAEDKNEALLKEIRDRFDYHCLAWQEIWEEGNKDMRYVAGDPWEGAERIARKEANRPCLVFDELQQHINQTVNEMRMNKLAIRVMPEGGGAQMQHAELRQARIRKIEYDSKAQTAYLKAYEDMVSRSYGYFGMLTEYCDDSGDDQRIKIRMFPNPNAISLDPDAKEAAAADMLDAFVLDTMPKSKFKRLYPHAEIRDFTSAQMVAAPRWISDNTVQVAEYWKVVIGSKKKFTLEGAGSLFQDEMFDRGIELINGKAFFVPERREIKILSDRKVETRKVKQYLTNGLEILDEIEWLGSWIPIFPMFGKELYVEEGGTTKRMLISRVRNARDPFMAYCYARSSEAELIRMTPKFPYMMYEGQEETQTDWENMNNVTTAFGTVKATVEGLPAGTILPLPQRQPYDPAIAPLEMFAEACKRAIQSAFGSYNASVGKEDTHARSGVAIKALTQQSTIGTYHFVDSDITALEQAGRCINEILDKIEAGPREVGVMDPDDTTRMVKINQEEGESPTYGEGRFGVTVSVGPSYQSQRDAASAFLDTLIQNLQQLPVAPEIKAKLISLAVKLKGLGPLGDEMAKLLDPAAGQDQQLPPQVQAKLQQSMQLVQAMKQHIDELEQEKAAKVVETQGKKEIAEMQEKTKILVAEINTKSQESSLRMKMEQEQWALLHGSAHEVGMQAVDQAHEATTQGADQSHEAGMQSAEQAHQADLAAQAQAMAAQEQPAQ